MEYFVTKHITNINSIELPYSEFNSFCNTEHTSKEVYMNEVDSQEEVVSLVELNDDLKEVITNLTLTKKSIQEIKDEKLDIVECTSEHVICSSSSSVNSSFCNTEHTSKEVYMNEVDSQEEVVSLVELNDDLKEVITNLTLTKKKSVQEIKDEKLYSAECPLNIISCSSLASYNCLEKQKEPSSSRRKQFLNPRLSLSVRGSVERTHVIQCSDLLFQLHSLSISCIKEIRESSDGVLGQVKEMMGHPYISIINKERDVMKVLCQAVAQLLEHLSVQGFSSVTNNTYLSLIKRKLNTVTVRVEDFESKSTLWIKKYKAFNSTILSDESNVLRKAAITVMCYSLHVCEVTRDVSRQSYNMIAHLR